MVNFLSAQNNNNQKNSPYIPEVYPKTPENSALLKNIELPPGTYTGTYGYKIDLGTVNLKSLNLPISLDYSTTGIKVNGISGRVGTGWVLNVGNISLNRDVRGVSDNLVQEVNLNKKYYNFNPNDGDTSSPNGNSDYSIARRLTGLFQGEITGNFPSLDANRDYYIYSLASNSGRFIEDSQGNFHTIPKDDLKILNNRTLVDNKGNTYYFAEYRSISNNGLYSNLNDSGISGPYVKNIGYAFRLDSIKLVTNEVIEFSYVKDDYKFTSAYNKSLDLKTSNTDKNPTRLCIDYGKMPSINRNHQEVTDYTIKEINYPNGKIVFDYIDNNQEVEGGKVLKSVKFYQNNQLYKDYSLESSFTTSESPSQIAAKYNENFSKRLFLFNVNERFTNANYTLDYYGVNQTSLQTDFPARFSGKEDYWGSYNHVGDFLPSSNFYTNNLGVLTKYDGANKNPNLNDAIIGSLQSIKFPTGGFQKIQYELDDFHGEGYKETYSEERNLGVFATFSEIRRSVTKTLVIQESSPIYKTKLEFLYEGMEKVDFNPPNDLPTVSHYKVKVYVNNILRITLYDKGPHDIYESPYIQNSIDVKNGDVLDFIFSYQEINSIGGNPKLTFNVPATVGLTYTVLKQRDIPSVNKNAGNLRVKELVLKENANTDTYKKQYIYRKFDKPNESSGYFLGRDMNMNFYTRKPYHEYNPDPNFFCEYLNVSSQNYYNLYALENKSVVYPNVTEKIINVKDNSFYTIDKKFSVPSKIGYSEFQLPFIQGPYNGYMGGLLLNEDYKNDNNKIVKTISNTYEFDNYFNQFSSKYDNEFPDYIYPAMDLSIRSTYGNASRQEVHTFDVNPYHYPSTWIKLMQTKEIDYLDNNKFIEKVKSFSYDYNQLKPIKELVSNSKGEDITTEYQYPSNLTTGYPESTKMNRLVNENRISEPVITKQQVGSVYVSEVRNQYNEFYGLLQKSAVFQKKGKDILITQTTDRKIVYNSYDAKGNMTQYTVENGLPVAIIWGYNTQYPIAKIEGANYSAVEQFVSALQTASNNGTLTKDSFSSLRTALPNAMITTYVYKPLVGVTTITGANGISENYTYDSANRLEEIKNDKNEVLKTFQYNYKN